MVTAKRTWTIPRELINLLRAVGNRCNKHGWGFRVRWGDEDEDE